MTSRRAPTPSRRPAPSVEHARLAESPDASDPWRLWGPYLAARQWGTVREDYSAAGDAWEAFPFEQAHRRAYRWGEDGIAGLCDRFGFLNLSIALWNGHDDRLKERFFGLTNPQGNHGEDVKEYWWHLDATPTHSYAQTLYRYPQAAYPYETLREVNAARGRTDDEFELSDTGILADDRFFDVVVTHAKAGPTDVVVTVTATNQGPDAAPLHIVPQLWFRNTWAWGDDDRVPSLRRLHTPEVDDASMVALEADHEHLGRYVLFAEGEPDLLVCDNETDSDGLWGVPGRSAHPKEAVDRAVVRGDRSAVNADETGTKAGLHYTFEAVPPGGSVSVRLRLTAEPVVDRPFLAVDQIVADRAEEAERFYDVVIPDAVDDVDRHTARRAFAGLLWGRQLYRYDVDRWLAGDPAGPVPPTSRRAPEPGGRNTAWRHLALADVISMPDEWEYPWFATWDLAFHAVALAHVDPAFAKSQLLLLCREWAQHPNGQLPAYEWAFSDVNPPVHAWAAWQVYLRDGSWDHDFLKRILAKLLLNVSWWVGRKDPDGSDLFEGGFLGMDNIGAFDRSRQVPPGWRLEQSDATAWMAFLCLSLMRIAQEVARDDHAYDDLATTFLERFLAICRAMGSFGSGGVSLWDSQDGFFYDVLVGPLGQTEPMRVRSMVGLLPLLAVANAPAWVREELPDFDASLRWLARHRPDEVASLLHSHPNDADSLTFAVVDPERLALLLRRLLDEDEFLSPHGIRSLSAAHRDGVAFDVAGESMSLRYTPGESDSGLFGGNSNWRGPVWFPVNVLLVDALHTYAAGAGAQVTVELPTGGGTRVGLHAAAGEIEERLVSLFRPGPDGRRPSDPRHVGTGARWSDHPTFSEYFHGDTGAGLGASHQTGWTALVAHLVCTTGTTSDREENDA
ncbi:glucosidase [Humibacillus sp. DSM 29435]|uniref:MGH1-like glycoside hydrolase domain-containing protein n=1 Tax=Humibacillus sp. DSM 29435 TaxID=1869167 RepID=UPI000871BD24|nr:glucosidase [Humibacillus sp. DSM 29435]OFE16527.1 glucosidase [Humibacillus sp. DSM 29435]